MRDKNLRDVLAHLHEWQRMLFGFVDANLHGQSRSFLPFPHTWRTTPALNQEIWEHYHDVSLDEIQALLMASRTQTVELIESFSDEELFTKKYFPWTGTTSLGSYFVSAAPSAFPPRCGLDRHWDGSNIDELSVNSEVGLSLTRHGEGKGTDA